jgi:hypothetical protein
LTGQDYLEYIETLLPEERGDSACPPCFALPLAGAGALAESGAAAALATTGILVAGTEVARQTRERTFLTYMLTNAERQVYVGRTSGFGTPQEILMQRYSSHAYRALGFGNPTVDVSAQGIEYYPAIRGREQQVIDYYGGVGSPNVANIIRGVSAFNPAGLLFHNESNRRFGPLAPYTGW